MMKGFTHEIAIVDAIFFAAAPPSPGSLRWNPCSDWIVPCYSLSSGSQEILIDSSIRLDISLKTEVKSDDKVFSVDHEYLSVIG